VQLVQEMLLWGDGEDDDSFRDEARPGVNAPTGIIVG